LRLQTSGTGKERVQEVEPPVPAGNHRASSTDGIFTR
jgi:hypothetical protein